MCGSTELEKFLDLGSQPLANKYPTEDEFATEVFFPLRDYFSQPAKGVRLRRAIYRERRSEISFTL